jgi:hypothetical protein
LTKTKIAGFDRSQGLAPLVIGITGHRDIVKAKPLSLMFRIIPALGLPSFMKVCGETGMRLWRRLSPISR